MYHVYVCLISHLTVFAPHDERHLLLIFRFFLRVLSPLSPIPSKLKNTEKYSQFENRGWLKGAFGGWKIRSRVIILRVTIRLVGATRAVYVNGKQTSDDQSERYPLSCCRIRLGSPTLLGGATNCGRP